MPPKFLFLLIAILPLARVSGQSNLSFERTDSTGRMEGTEAVSGHVTRTSAYYFFGLPFTATHESYFARFEHDTLASPMLQAKLSLRFALADTPRSILFDAFYVPVFTHQRYNIAFVFTRWNGIKRDTVMMQNTNMDAVADSQNRIPVKWSERQINLAPFGGTIPDSGYVTITLDAVAPQANSTLLLIDNIRFHKWFIGGAEQEPAHVLSMFPNPASTAVHISGLPDGEAGISIHDIHGRMISSSTTTPDPSGNLTIATDEIPPGLYFIRIRNGASQIQLKLAISR